MKKISIMLLICSLMCFALPAYAQDTIDSEMVTYEEMAAAVEAIGDEYGIDLKLTQYIPLTREEAQIELEYYRNSAAAISENQNSFRMTTLYPQMMRTLYQIQSLYLISHLGIWR